MLLETKPQQGAINFDTFEPFRNPIVSFILCNLRFLQKADSQVTRAGNFNKLHDLDEDRRAAKSHDVNLSASPGITAAETKECADKLVNTRSQRASSTSKPDMKRDLMPRKETSKELALSPTPTTTKKLLIDSQKRLYSV